VTLFDVAGVSRRTDPETSRDAAAVVSAGVEDAVLRVHQSTAYLVGFTDDELAAVLHRMHPPTVKTARSRLSRRGLLIDSGLRRPSNRGRDQIVWCIP
jgi:hypothetical protein